MTAFMKLLKGARTGGIYVGTGILLILWNIVGFLVPVAAGGAMVWWAITLFQGGSIIWGIVVLLIGTPIAYTIASYAAPFLFIAGIITAIIWGIINLFGLGTSFSSVWDIVWLVVKTLVLLGLAFYVLYSIYNGDWSRRHLNWTLVILWVTVFPLLSIIGGIIGIPQIVINWLVPLFILLPFTGWALKRKNRSLWWLLLFIIPPLWLVYLGLKNRSQKVLEAPTTA
jgi:hypothetical protein